MAVKETTAQLTFLTRSLLIGDGLGAFTADQIIVAEMPATGVARGEDLLTELNKKYEDGNFISSSANLPVADADSAPLHYRTDENAIYVKERTGASEPYTYNWLGPIDRGDYQLRLIYHTGADPSGYGLTWDWLNENFNITSGGWTLNEAGANWMRIVELPANSNTPSVSPRIRIGDPTAAEISVTSPNGQGNLPSSISDLQELLNWLDQRAQFGSGGTTPTPTAQDTPLWQIVNYDAPTRNPPVFRVQDSHVEESFTVDPALVTHQSRFGERIFIEGVADVELEGSTVSSEVTLELSIRDSNGAVLSDPILGSITETPPDGTTPHRFKIRLSGLLPINFTSGRWRVTVRATHTPPTNGFAAHVRLDIHPDIKADEVTVNPDDYGNNLLSSLTLRDVGDAISQVDELPIQFADYEGLAWTAPPTGIDLDGALDQRQQDIPIHMKIRDVNGRPGHAFIAKISFDVNYITGTRSDGGGAVDYVHDIHTDADNYANAISARADNQDVNPRNINFEIDIPASATRLRITWREPVNQSNTPISQMDGRLNVANYRCDFQEGIDVSGFTAQSRIISNNARSLQSFAQAVYNYVPPNTAAGITVDSTEFDDPETSPGGLRDTVPGTAASPANVQQALVKTDAILQRQDNPFIGNANVQHMPATFVRDDFVVNTNAEVRSDPITIPQELRDLGVDIAIRLRIHVDAITSDFDSNLSFVDATSFATLTDTMTNRVRGSGTSDAYTTGDFVTFQETISAANVPETFRVQFDRDSTTGNATFDRGVVYFVDRPGGATGGVGGDAGTGWEIIWEAGPGNSDRVTAVGFTSYTLANSARFDDFTDFEAIFDTNATAAVAISEHISYDEISRMLTANLPDTQGTWIHIRYNYKLIKPLSQTTFRIPAGDTGIGLRRIRGRRA